MSCGPDFFVFNQINYYYLVFFFQCCTTKRAIIERLRFSPITIQINISPKSQSPKIHICDLLNYIYTSLDQAYIPIKQAKYTITAFELDNISTNMDQLFLEIFNYYKSQVLQQFHVHVLGQDVLLNPYGVNAPQNVCIT